MKIEVLSHYSSGIPECKRCGMTDIRTLTLDHINMDGAEHRRELKSNPGLMYRDIKREGYVREIQVLCYNCHRIVEYERRGWGHKDIELNA